MSPEPTEQADAYDWLMNAKDALENAIGSASERLQHCARARYCLGRAEAEWAKVLAKIAGAGA